MMVGRYGLGAVMAAALLVGGGIASGSALAPGDLDPSFGRDGWETTGFGSGSAQAHAIAVQGDGKLVVAGFQQSGDRYDFAIVRYTSSGRLDRTFGGDGKVLTDFGSANDIATGIAVQADGKIVVGGYTIDEGGDFDFALARYQGSGRLDRSFGSQGLVTTDLGGDEVVHAIALQDDGRILVAGDAGTANGDDFDFAVMRYTGTGQPDSTFGDGGSIVTAFGPDHDVAQAVAVQEDGKVVLVGYADTGAGFDFALARYRPGGALDQGFGIGGRVTTDFPSGSDRAWALAIQEDGRIVLGGESFPGEDSDFALARYLSSGDLDLTFGGDGTVTSSVGDADDRAFGVTIQADGAVVTVGDSVLHGNHRFALMRHTASGDLDLTFGGTGTVITDFGDGDDGAEAVALQEDGKIVATGYADDRMVVARYLAF
jgi:uncharacterized delta-60 repeat protein